jgi:hypothetical protein
MSGPTTPGPSGAAGPQDPRRLSDEDQRPNRGRSFREIIM